MERAQSRTKPGISVIVPVYKAEAFLDQCVQSILGQTERDFELLLVDDGSPDGSPAMCDAYAAQDLRVRVIHKPNGGVSSARNAGLDAAAGDYIVFIDSDDYVDGDYLEALLRAARESEAPDTTLILTDYQPFAEDGDRERKFPAPFTTKLDDPGTDLQVFRDLIFGFRLFPPYCKLYRRDVIEALGLRFDPSIRSAEDFDFNMRYLTRMKAVRYLPIRTYHYRVDYKIYRPSNRGVLGDSEIKSAHLMAHGIVDLAKRMGLYEGLRPEIEAWAANKHYCNRMRMLFAPGEEVGRAERKRLYKRLIADPVYYQTAKRGRRSLPKSTTKGIAVCADRFAVWHLFYAVIQNRTKQK